MAARKKFDGRIALKDLSANENAGEKVLERGVACSGIEKESMKVLFKM